MTDCTERCLHGRSRVEGCKPCFWVGEQCRCQPPSTRDTEGDGTEDDGFCCESLRHYGTCTCPDRDQVVGR